MSSAIQAVTFVAQGLWLNFRPSEPKNPPKFYRFSFGHPDRFVSSKHKTMTTTKHLLPAIAVILGGYTLQAQNTFPVSGPVGIGTLAPVSALEITTTEVLGGNALQISPFFTAAGQEPGQFRMMETSFSGTDYVAFRAPFSLAAPTVYTWPVNDGENGQFLTSDGFGNLSWTSVSKGANKKLSNLTAPTAVNQALLPNADNTLDLGSIANSWNDVYADGKGFFGEIGIGVSTIDGDLTISGVNELMTLEGTDPYIQFENAGLDKGYIRALSNDMFITTNVLNTTGRLMLGTKSAEHLYLHPDGEVTINSAMPYAGFKLGVAGDVYVSSQLAVGTTTLDATAQVTLSGTDDVLVIDGSAPYITMQDAGFEVGFVQANGEDLKIGTFAGNDNGRLIFRTNGFDRGMVDQNGNFLIGNPNSVNVATGFRLSVDGKVMCEELRVEMSPWADYVFEENYPLPTFDELESFIAANKHLPGIPPAAQIESEGLDVGSMQAKMMEKIEELTLLVIQLNNRIEELEADNQ